MTRKRNKSTAIGDKYFSEVCTANAIPFSNPAEIELK